MNRNSYLVRIYRREENDPRILIGIIEEIGKAGKKAFNNFYELWDILNPDGSSPYPFKKSKKPQKERKRRRTNESVI